MMNVILLTWRPEHRKVAAIVPGAMTGQKQLTYLFAEK
jgi:hypothetical protein